MSLEEKFNAAVNVIRSLPKSGSYQPSNELMLRFYSYYKQASEGPCDKPKPGFWDVVNRAKWESWSKLGNMTREEAMLAYVHELHKIVETMAYSENVAEFLSTGGGGDDEDERAGGFPTEDLELVAGDVLARVRSEHNSPIGSRSISPTGSPRAASPSAQAAAHAHAHRNRHDSDDEFIDTVDSEPEALPPPARAVQAAAAPPAACRDLPRLSNGHAHQITSQLTHLKVLEELPGTLARLERDVAALRKAVEGDRAMLNGSSRKWRWPWQELSPPTLLFVLLWPIVVTRLVSRRRRT